MTAENANTISRTRLERRPCIIFRVELRGGQRLEIDHSRGVVLREGAAVFVASGCIPMYIDHDSVNQITIAPSDTAA
jgi:hypothetical protein